jgi:hypothetical protein
LFRTVVLSSKAPFFKQKEERKPAAPAEQNPESRVNTQDAAISFLLASIETAHSFMHLRVRE